MNLTDSVKLYAIVSLVLAHLLLSYAVEAVWDAADYVLLEMNLQCLAIRG